MNIKIAIENLNVPDILSPFGTKITSKEDFEQIKPKIQKLLCEKEYGYIPPAPKNFSVEVLDVNKNFAAGKAPYTKYKLTAELDGGEASFVFYSVIPKNSSGKLSTFIHINFSDLIPHQYQPTEEIIDRNYAVFTVNYQDVTSDDDDFQNGCAKILCKNRSHPHAPGKIAIWAWAVMRIIDYVETLNFFNPEALAVIGHSRLGKTTLLAAAFDERIKFACVNNSGASGDALSRGKRGEDIEAITKRFPYWFCPTYKEYANRENELPFDQHFLLSLVAPRYLVIGTAMEDIWADPTNEFLALTLTDDVYKLYGKKGLVHDEDMPLGAFKLQEGDCSFHLREGLHYLSRYDWNLYMDFIDSKINTK